MKNKILVSGYYGYNNIGDEAILRGLVDGIATEGNAQITVLSKNPDWTKKKYNVLSVNRSNLFDIIKAIRECDMVVSGGGSLMQDVTSKKSILYYLGILFLGKIFGKKTFIYSQGIGPIHLKRNRVIAKWILEKVDFINVRDNQSKREIRELGIKQDPLVTTDTVFGIKKPSPEAGKELLNKLGVDSKKKNICFTIIDWKDYGRRTVTEIVKSIIDIKSEVDANIILVPFFYHQDLKIEKKIQSILKDLQCEDVYLVDEYLHVNEYLSLVSNMDMMVSMRLHGLIFATLMGAYPIGISYDPKIDGFMKELDRIQKFYVEDFDGSDLAKEVIQSYEKLDELKVKTQSYLEKFYKQAEVHNKKVYEVLGE